MPPMVKPRKLFSTLEKSSARLMVLRSPSPASGQMEVGLLNGSSSHMMFISATMEKPT